VIDEVVKEPLGGGHRDPPAIAQTLKEVVIRHFSELEKLGLETLLKLRYEKFRKMGPFIDGGEEGR